MITYSDKYVHKFQNKESINSTQTTYYYLAYFSCFELSPVLFY